MEKPYLLHMITPEKNIIPFDANMAFDAGWDSIEYGRGNTSQHNIKGIIISNITASGNISSSGTIFANDLILDYDSLPTSDPSVKWQVYRNVSNQLFISAG